MFVTIWKPKGPTSHDVVDAVRRITEKRRVGHAGTLDPMAEGVLVIGVGRDATRQLKEIVGQEKEYVATVWLGATSTTDDAEGEITQTQNAERSVRGEIENVLKQFVGAISQTPPTYSAVKIRGTPAHRRVRRGEDVQLEPRTIDIKAIELLGYEWPELELRIVCGPGTYIRALARDIGRALGTGGYLTRLTRTRVGAHTRETALTIEQFRVQWSGNR